MDRPRVHVGLLLIPLALVIALEAGTLVGVSRAEESPQGAQPPIPPQVLEEWQAERAKIRQRWDEEQAKMREHLQAEKERMQKLWEQEEARTREYWHGQQEKLKQMLEADKAKAHEFWQDYYEKEARKHWPQQR